MLNNILLITIKFQIMNFYIYYIIDIHIYIYGAYETNFKTN